MNLAGTQSNPFSPSRVISILGQYSGVVVGIILTTALVFFEMFNYSTTDFALRDLLGDLRFLGVHWSTLLSLAFCGIDFAGIVRLFAIKSSDPSNEVWYLFGAWMIAATMNAVLTWWGVSMAIASHPIASASVVNPVTITRVVPLFVAIMVWVIRILLIGSISMAVDRLLHGRTRQRSQAQASSRMGTAAAGAAATASAPRYASSSRPAVTMSATPSRHDPSYHSVSPAATGAGYKSVSPRG